MKVEVPLGDVVDKVTILRIKQQRLTDARALDNVKRECASLLGTWHNEGHTKMEMLPQYGELAEVNEALWEVEDRLREHEARGDFGDDFVTLARSVYRLNDRRAALKRAINDALGSALIEEKSYGRESRGER